MGMGAGGAREELVAIKSVSIGSLVVLSVGLEGMLSAVSSEGDSEGGASVTSFPAGTS